jgi:hypothetical protein
VAPGKAVEPATAGQRDFAQRCRQLGRRGDRSPLCQRTSQMSGRQVERSGELVAGLPASAGRGGEQLAQCRVGQQRQLPRRRGSSIASSSPQTTPSQPW